MIETLIGLGYLGILIACFLSATLVPFSADLVVMGFLAVVKADPWLCLAVATLGGWMGGVLNFYLGRLGKEEWIRKHSRIREDRLLKVKTWMQGKGGYMAFFSWFPLVGSLITISLGYFRAGRFSVILFLLIGMLVRYLVVIGVTLKGLEVAFS